MKRLYIIAFISFILDFVCKFIITHILSFNDSIMVIKNFFYISLVKNTGGAFSIFTGSTFLLIVISFLILLGIFTYIYKNNIRNRVSLIGFGLLIGGAMGNLFDRIFYGYVIDYLDFKIFGYGYPIFNLADSFVVIGAIMLLFFAKEVNNGRRC